MLRREPRSKRSEQGGMKAQPVFTYLANTLRTGDREIPYSLVTAVDLSTIVPALPPTQAEPPIVLNEWAARELEAAPGDAVTMEYYRWEDPGRLDHAHESSFRVAAVVPVSRRRSQPCARVSGHQRFADAWRLGSAVSDRLASDPSC